MRLMILILAILCGAPALVAAQTADVPWSDAQARFDVDKDLLIPTPDGAQIATIIVRPRGSTKLTALLGFTIYADDKRALADAVKAAEHGYAGVVAYTRGKGRSPGAVIPYEHDGADAAAVIEWLARQTWSDGRVGMFGGSYNSFTQWAAAKHMPKALKAMATSASNAPGIDTPMWRGVFQNFVYPWPLYTTKTKYLDDAGYGETARWSGLNRAWYVAGASYRQMQTLDREPNPVFAKWLRHPTYDAYWQAMTPQGAEFAKIDIPVLAITGYFDGGAVGALHYLREHLRYNPRADHRLLIGPYDHFAVGRGVLPRIGSYDVDPAARLNLQDIRFQWFDHVFRGKPLPDVLKDRVNFQVMGADRWRHAPSLEAMGDKPLSFHLAQDGAVLRLTEHRPARESGIDLVVDLADRSDADIRSPWGPVLDKLDTRNALVFPGPAMTRPTEINGAFTAHLAFTTNKRDFDFGVSLYQQMPDGRYFSLAWSMYRASQVRDPRRRQLLTPGRRTRLTVQSDRLTSRLMAPGSRIVAVLWISKDPNIQINYGSGKDVSDETIADAGKPLAVRWSTNTRLDLRKTD